MSCGRQAPALVPEGYDAGEDTEHFLEYSASKYEAEHRMVHELPGLPLVVARPSIVVGHTRLGCKPSGSIYWVFRIARALQAFPCELDQCVDVIPVDYCAQVLEYLINAPVLRYRNYHISAGTQRACRFGEIDAAIAKAVGAMPMKNYRAIPFDQIALMQNQFPTVLGPCNRRLVLRAIRAYGELAKLGMIFDNSRLLAEGIDLAPRFSDYVGLCELTSAGTLIADQMKFDYK